MTTLTANQQVILNNLASCNLAWRSAKADAAARAKIIVEQEILAYLFEMDREVRMAVNAGIPKQRIAKEGLRTSSPNTLYESLGRTETMSNLIEQKEVAKEIVRFAWQGFDKYGMNVFSITMAGEDWKLWRTEHKHQSRRSDLWNDNTADFRLNMVGTFGPLDLSDHSTRNKIDHPVIAWSKFYDEGTIQAWIDSHPAPVFVPVEQNESTDE